MRKYPEIDEKEYPDYEIVYSSDNCRDCLFQCKIIVHEKKQINLYCRHPKGPGKPEHCIYFKRKKQES